MFTETRKKIVLPALASVFFKNKEMELHVRKKILCFNLNKYFLLSIFFFKKKKKNNHGWSQHLQPSLHFMKSC